MRIIGIIGGMGPQATLTLLQRIIDLTPARADQDHIPTLICNDPRVPDRTEAIRGKGPSPVPALVEAGRRLHAAGAEMLAMPCNTAHHFLPEVRAQLPLPFIDLIEEVAAHLAGLLPAGATVGLLATDGVVTAELYHRALAARGLRALAPDPAGQRVVMEVIYGEAGVKRGVRAPAQAEALAEVMRGLRARGATAFIAGCTELDVVFAAHPVDAGGPIISSTDVLARAIIREARRGDGEGRQGPRARLS